MKADRGPNFVLTGVLATARSRDRRPLLGSVTAPTLVIHGTEDGLSPFVHAEALAEAIPGATLMPVEGWGHDGLLLADGIVERFAAAILDHTSAHESDEAVSAAELRSRQ